MKRGGKRHNWKKRYFILKDEYLYYFASEESSTAASGSIHLLMASVKRSIGEFQMASSSVGAKKAEKEKDKEKELMLEIITSGRTYFIIAPSEGDLIDWINQLRGSTQRGFRIYLFSHPTKRVFGRSHESSVSGHDEGSREAPHDSLWSPLSPRQ
jgi:hypothetical protein